MFKKNTEKFLPGIYTCRNSCGSGHYEYTCHSHLQFFIGQHHAYTVQDQVIEMEQNARPLRT